MRADVVDQILAIACHSGYIIIAPILSVNMIMNLAQSPGAHPYLVRTEVIEDLLKIHTVREKLVVECPPEKKLCSKQIFGYIHSNKFIAVT